jgi:hypothetical protein
LSWVCGLPGRSDLKAHVGFLPPYPANPPTKRPLVSLIKQARAFGVGVVLATQNPMDVDCRVPLERGPLLHRSTPNRRRSSARRGRTRLEYRGCRRHKRARRKLGRLAPRKSWCETRTSPTAGTPPESPPHHEHSARPADASRSQARDRNENETLCRLMGSGLVVDSRLPHSSIQCVSLPEVER